MTIGSHHWLYCPMCGSCGVGGCCGYFCDACKERHDGETQTGEAPRDLGDLWLMQGGWKRAVAKAEAECAALKSQLAATQERLAQMERDEDMRRTLNR